MDIKYAGESGEYLVYETALLFLVIPQRKLINARLFAQASKVRIKITYGDSAERENPTLDTVGKLDDRIVIF